MCVHYPPVQGSLLFLVLVHQRLQSHGWSHRNFVNPGMMADVSDLLANVATATTVKNATATNPIICPFHAPSLKSSALDLSLPFGVNASSIKLCPILFL